MPLPFVINGLGRLGRALVRMLATSREELVSSDFMGDPHSAVVDLPLTRSVGKDDNSGLYRVVAWYDNEWGHASRLADILEMLAKQDARER